MITVNELFSGIGAQAKALERLQIEHTVSCTCDLDYNAIISYAAIHNGLTLEMIKSFQHYPSRREMADHLSEMNIGYDFKAGKPYNWHKYVNTHNLFLNKAWLACYLSNQVGDITRVEKLPKADLWTYSFPCQDISSAGLQRGLQKGAGTRSGALWEVERLLNVAKDKDELPQYLLMENVKALVSKKFKPEFEKWLSVLSKLGYKTYWAVLNAKDYGVPQNRERVFAVSFLDKGRQYEFPKAVPLIKRLKDILEQDVPEKYYLKDEVVKKLHEHLIRNREKGNGFGWKPTDGNCVANCVKTEGGYRPDSNFVFIEKLRN